MTTVSYIASLLRIHYLLPITLPVYYSVEYNLNRKQVELVNGTAHATIGAGVGFAVAQFAHTDLTTSFFLVGIGVVAGLLPDIDVDGKLSNRITFSHVFIRSVAQIIGLMIIIYTIFDGKGTEKWIGIGIGIAIFVISSFIKQRHMLTITGIGVLAGGLSLDELWLIMLGVYIIIASFIAHRSYTHSLLGVIYVAITAHHLEGAIKIEGIYLTCILGYISHLVADIKILPFNKRGVKLFLPFSSKEI
jgi:inner membrane protein